MPALQLIDAPPDPAADTLAALRWAVKVGVALVPSARAGIVVVDPRHASRTQAMEIPPAVFGALSRSWRSVRAAVDEACSTIAAAGVALPDDVVTALAWTQAERAELRGDALELWHERAAVLEYDGGLPRWIADALAVEQTLSLQDQRPRPRLVK